MDAFHHHHHHHQSRRFIGPPIGGDQPPPPQQQQQSPFWYPSSSPPPPPPGGYHHHQHPHLSPHSSASAPLNPHPYNYPPHNPPYHPPPPQQQWDHPGDAHHHLQKPLQHPQMPSYPSHLPVPPYPTPLLPPHRYPPPPRPHHAVPSPHPPHHSSYPPPNQAWENSSWVQNQGWEYPERNFPFNHEEDWAARAKAWAASKSEIDNHDTQPQLTPIGRVDGHSYGYHDQYQQAVRPPADMQRPSLPQSSNQQWPDFQKQDQLHGSTSFSSGSSYRTDGRVYYNAGDEAIGSNADQMASPQKSYGPIASVYEQEVPYSYSSAPGNRAVDLSESSHITLPLPVSSVQEGLHSQATLPVRNISEQPHFNHGGQSTRLLNDASDLPLDFEPRSVSEHLTYQKVSYGYADPAVSVGVMDNAAMTTSIHAWNPSAASGFTFSQISLAPSGTQFDTLAVHPAPVSGRIPGPNLQPSIPPGTVPFGLATGTSVHHLAAFPGDANGAFNLSERPKKAAVPNWLREEINKKKSALGSVIPMHPSGNSFHSIGSEDADKSFKTADQADSKSIDSTKSIEEEEDDEDDVEAARSAAINQEIKRVLTEVLLKVTDELFDEIAIKVLKEDDLSVEVEESAVSGNHKVLPSPPAVPTPRASAKVLIQVKENKNYAGGSGENSSMSSPGGDLLGLANYASDDDDENESSTLLSSGMIVGVSHQLEINNGSSENVTKEVEKGNALVNSQEPSRGPRDIESKRNRMAVNGSPRNPSARNTEGSCMADNASRSSDDLYYHEKAPKEVSGIREELVSGGKASEVPLQNSYALKLKEPRLESTSGTANIVKPMTGECSVTVSKILLANSGNPEKRGDNRDTVNEVKSGMMNTGCKISDVSDSIIHEDSNGLKKKNDGRDNSKERFEDRGVKKGANVRDSDSRSISKHDSIKDNRKDSKDKREKKKEDGERKREQTRDWKEDRSTRVTKGSFGYDRTRSTSPNSRGRKSKENSSGGHGSASSDGPESSKKRKLQSSRSSLSPSPTRSRKRQVSRSPPSKHSHRRHSPYSSMERRRRSRSRTPPVHRRSVHKHGN